MFRLMSGQLCRLSPFTQKPRADYCMTDRIRDLRTNSIVQSYTEFHSDDVTSLSFHPRNPHHLLSGSVDGLYQVIDTRLGEDDDADISTGPVGASIHIAGWFYRQQDVAQGERESIFALTHMETLSLWDPSEVCKKRESGQEVAR
jgi:WD40 repeat protein